jgi:hypothetical protein
MPLTKEIFLHLLFESLPPHLKNPEKGAGKVNSEKNIQNAKRGEKLIQDQIKKGSNETNDQTSNHNNNNNNDNDNFLFFVSSQI